MKSFIHDDFLLQTDAARDLYRAFARAQPIYDYHCHLPAGQIAANVRLLARGCLNCHSQIHGSNSPNGAFLTR